MYVFRTGVGVPNAVRLLHRAVVWRVGVRSVQLIDVDRIVTVPRAAEFTINVNAA